MADPDWLGLRHLALEVADLEVVASFYKGLFGYREEWRPDPDNVYLTSGPDNLALHRAKGPLSGSGALDHLGFVVARPAAVDDWHDRARSFGAEVLAPPRTHRDGARSFYLRDPEGNRIQILYHPPLAPDATRGG